jgi:DNA-binding response OmpR family regulator
MAKPYILIAEDDPSLQTVIAETFRIAGYQVDATGDGDEVLPLFEGRRPDAVILDVSMPGKNGFEICRELRARPDGRTLPIVVLTARTADADRHWGIDAGADEYLTKPFDPGSLTAAVAGLIESRLRGEDRNPISKLPDLGSLARRIAELERSGLPLTAVAVEFEPESAAVHRQKYGDLRFADAIRAAAGCLRQALAAAVVDTPGLAAPAPLLLGHAGDVSYSRFALIGAPAAVYAAADHAGALFHQKALKLYDTVDRERGYVEVRQPGGGTMQVPLLTLRSEGIAFSALADIDKAEETERQVA